ncbi:MAG: xynA5 [Paenibacillus sp.]|jgi:hypothetical protein|nr:xynA5 [Paenibacillus sp.]
MNKTAISFRKNRLKLLFAAAIIVFMRRTLHFAALVSVPAVLLSQGSPLSAEAKPEDIRFSDIEGHWAEEPIAEAVSSGIASGYEDGTFKPDRVISGREFITMLASSLQIPRVAALSDRSNGDKSNDPLLESLLDAGILQADEFSDEAIDHELRRSDMIKLAVNALEPEGAGGEPDVIWKRAETAGLLDSAQEEQAALESKATRAEAVVVLQRLQRLLGLKKVSSSSWR